MLSPKQREAHPALFPTFLPFVVYRLCPEYFVFSSIEQAECSEVNIYSYMLYIFMLLRHIGLLEADEDEIRKIRPKGTLFRILYVPREAIRPKGG